MGKKNYSINIYFDFKDENGYKKEGNINIEVSYEEKREEEKGDSDGKKK